MSLCKFGQNPSTGLEDNAWKLSYGDADPDLFTLQLVHNHLIMTGLWSAWCNHKGVIISGTIIIELIIRPLKVRACAIFSWNDTCAKGQGFPCEILFYKLEVF